MHSNSIKGHPGYTVCFVTKIVSGVKSCMLNSESWFCQEEWGGKAHIHHSYKYNYKLIQYTITKEEIQQKTKSTYVNLVALNFSGNIYEHAV